MSSARKSNRRDGFLSITLICLSVSLLLLFCSSAETPPSEIETGANNGAIMHLAPGAGLSRELAPGAQEVIAVWVGQGRLLRFSIDKGDFAISTVLYGPTETKLFEHVSHAFETVEISFPADVTGSYKIEVRSLEQSGPGRRFELLVNSLTPVTVAARKDSEARQVFARAEVWRATWVKESLRRAITEFDTATLMWASLSDTSHAAAAMIKAGDVCFLLSDYPEARKRFEGAAELSSKRGDRMSEGRALSRLARLYSYTGDNRKAERTVNKALELLQPRQANLTPIAANAYGEALSVMAEVAYAKGNFSKSRSQFESARQLLSGNRKSKARTHLFSGYIAGSIGQLEKAAQEISQAQALFQASGDNAGVGLARTAMGLFHAFKGEGDQAIRIHGDAISIFQVIGDRHSQAIALTALGQSYEARNALPEALDNYERALRLFEEIGGFDLVANALLKVATVHRVKENFEQALSLYKRSLALSRAAKKTRTEALTLDDIAVVYDAQGRTEEALKQYRIIQKFYEDSGDVRGQAVALNTYGGFLFRRDQTQRALELFSRALPLSERVGDAGTFLTTLYNLARAHLRLGSYKAAFSFIDRSIKRIEELRGSVGSPEARAVYFSAVRRHYELWADALMQLHRARPNEGHDAKALLVSDQSRARSLLDLLSESTGDLRVGAAAELLERERELRGLILKQALYQMELSLNPKDSTEVAEVANEISQLLAEYQEIQAQLRDQNPHVMPLHSFEPTSIEQIQTELRDSDTVLLQFALGDERSYLWAVTADSLRSYELPARKIIEDAARKVYALSTARQIPVETIKGDYKAYVEAQDNALPEKASRLSEMLLGTVSEQLGNRKLLIVAEGALQSISFDALPTPGTQLTGPNNWDAYVNSWLINTHEISFLPSISTLLAIRSAKHSLSSPDRTVAVIADPVFSGNDERVRPGPITPIVAGAASEPQPDGSAERDLRGLSGVSRANTLSRLTYSSAEADAISAAAPSGTTMIAKGFAANRETAMSSRLGEYQIIHFATHGFLDSEHPELSGIVLTMVDPKGVRQNGLMPLHDIYSLQLSAELTVLSACQTALGKDISGEGLVGLTHSFMSAGSKSVVASLWKVDDRATADLMPRLYESLLQQGMSTGAALRAAKLKTMKEKQWRAPYFWAGFVLQGEYTNRIVIADDWSLHPRWVLLALLVLLSSGVIVFSKRRRRCVRAEDLNQA
jgi:CHAT domain-containing protein/Tfp pilus assembly protein PilF